MGYLFDPDVLQQIVDQVIELPLEDKLERTVDELAQRYPGHIQRDSDWIFNNAGGAMGMMKVLHASVSEYVILFGSSTGTEGHSGRFWAEDFFFVLDGEHWTYGEGQLEREVFRPGDMAHLGPGQAKGYRMPDRCFALEYARGAIPLMLPFGLADTFSSTLDVRSLGRTLRVYLKSALSELAQGKL
jgi:C-8 sterol isomerase